MRALRLGTLVGILGLVVPATATAQVYLDAAGIFLNVTSKIVESGGAIRLNANGNVIGPENGYEENLGELTKKYLTLHAAELWVETLVAQNTIATIGGRVLVIPTNILTADLGSGAGDTTITVKYNNFLTATGANCSGGSPCNAYMEADGKVEFFWVVSAASGSGPYTYTVERDKDGSGRNAWFAGDAIVSTVAGFMDLYSLRGIKSASEIGPTIVGNIRNSSTYNDWSPRWAVGRLDGMYGYSSTTCSGGPCFGAVFGVSAGARVSMDPFFGIQIYDGTNTPRVSITPAGDAIFSGTLTVGTGRNVLRNSECRVGTESWADVTTNSGLTIATGFALSGFRLNDESNACYFTVTGTPANGTITRSGYAEFFPVVTGKKYEVSSYLGTNGGTSHVFIGWYDSSFTLLSFSSASPTCLSTQVGGPTLASWCRTGLVALAPASATYARMFLQQNYNGSDLNPTLFYVRMYFGEATPTQSGLTEWAGAGTTEITGGLIKTDAVDARIIAADTITANEIAANAITATELAADSVTSAKIAANTIVAADIAADTLTAAEIAANAITTSELNADSVTSAKIVAGTIVASDIATNTITADRLSVSTLSSITADFGTMTAGSITGGTIDGATIRAGSGDEVTLNSSGITLSDGSGTANKIKWSGGTEIWSTASGNLFVNSDLSLGSNDFIVRDIDSSGDIGMSGTLFEFPNIPSSTGTTVIWENACACLKKDSSSLRYKMRVRAWDQIGASRVLDARLIRFDFKDGGAKDVIGIDADALYEIAPDLVNLDSQGRPDSVRQGAMNAYLIATIRELRQELEALKARVK